MFQVTTSDFAKVNVTNSKTSAVAFEQKFAKNLSIEELKCKLEIMTGGCAGTMSLELFNGDTLVAALTNGTLLGSYPIEDGMRIHVTDSFQFADVVENVPKFELSDQSYDSKRNTVRDFLRTNKMGKYNEDERAKMEEQARLDAKEMDRQAALAVVGARCMVCTPKAPRRIGTIMYNGSFAEKPGIFIGVKFDEPLGVNDGTVGGKRYFECEPNYGSMVPVSAVTVGDYPPIEYDLDEEI